MKVVKKMNLLWWQAGYPFRAARLSYLCYIDMVKNDRELNFQRKVFRRIIDSIESGFKATFITHFK